MKPDIVLAGSADIEAGAAWIDDDMAVLDLPDGLGGSVRGVMSEEWIRTLAAAWPCRAEGLAAVG